MDDREKEAFQLGKQRAVRPCGRRPMEHAEEWEEGQCGWSLESERRLEVLQRGAGAEDVRKACPGKTLQDPAGAKGPGNSPALLGLSREAAVF